MSVMELRRRLLEQLQHFDDERVRDRWITTQGRLWTAHPATVLSLIAADKELPAGPFSITVAPVSTADGADDAWEVLDASLLVSYPVRVAPATEPGTRGWDEILRALQAVGRELGQRPAASLTRRVRAADAWEQVTTVSSAIAPDPIAGAYAAAIVWTALAGSAPETPAALGLPAHAVYERFDVLTAAQFAAETILAGIDTPAPAPVERIA